MIQQAKVKKLLANHDLVQIEKHLIYSYVEKKNIAYSLSNILDVYLSGFTPIDSLLGEIAGWCPNNIKELENTLELIIPAEDRKLNGAFFTPTFIVDYIIDELAPTEQDKNLDPSCGSGAFLIGLVDYYKRVYNRSIRDSVVNNIFGSDILEYNITRAKLLLSIYALQFGEVLENNDFNLYHQDSLRAQWDLNFEIIIGNPPYVKFQDLSSENREYLLTGWETIKNGAFNLYFPFFELGYNLLTNNGKLAFITPNNYFTSLAGEPLRAFFSENRCVNKIIDFGHKKIFDAQTYTAITCINKVENDYILYDYIQENDNPSTFLNNLNFAPVIYNDLVTKKWRLLKGDENEAIHVIENAGTALGKLFDIAVGIATLKDDVFFVDGSTLNKSLISKSTSNGYFQIEHEITKPVYKISDFKNQNDVNSNSRRVIYPYIEKNGNITPMSEEQMAADYPKCYEYLKSEKDQLLARDKGKINYNPFYVWGRTQGLNKKGLKLITPTFSQLPRFLQVAETDSFFTNGYAIFYKPLGSSLFDTVNLIALPENITVLQKILNSSIMDYYVKKTSVSISGGYPCYQKNFIEKFAIPFFSVTEINLLKELQGNDVDSFIIDKYQLNELLGNLVL